MNRWLDDIDSKPQQHALLRKIFDFGFGSFVDAFTSYPHEIYHISPIYGSLPQADRGCCGKWALCDASQILAIVD